MYTVNTIKQCTFYILFFFLFEMFLRFSELLKTSALNNFRLYPFSCHFIVEKYSKIQFNSFFLVDKNIFLSSPVRLYEYKSRNQFARLIRKILQHKIFLIKRERGTFIKFNFGSRDKKNVKV